MMTDESKPLQDLSQVTLVVPCKDEALRLDRAAFLRAVEEMPGMSILFVDDGSVDATADVLSRLAAASPVIEVLSLPENVGKAEAVRAGMLHLLANGGTGLVGFWDADLATPLEEVKRFLEVFRQHPGVGMVIGSRRRREGAHIERSVVRNFLGAAMRLLIRAVLHIPVYDTQCGAKVMTRALAGRIFGRAFISRWLFDLELLQRMGRNAVLQQVRELPLNHWHDVGASKMSFRAEILSVVDLFRIALKRPFF